MPESEDIEVTKEMWLDHERWMIASIVRSQAEQDRATPGSYPAWLLADRVLEHVARLCSDHPDLDDDARASVAASIRALDSGLVPLPLRCLPPWAVGRRLTVATEDQRTADVVVRRDGSIVLAESGEPFLGRIKGCLPLDREREAKPRPPPVSGEDFVSTARFPAASVERIRSLTAGQQQETAADCPDCDGVGDDGTGPHPSWLEAEAVYAARPVKDD